MYGGQRYAKALLEVVIRRGLKPPHQHGPDSSHQVQKQQELLNGQRKGIVPGNVASCSQPVVQHFGVIG